jgi:hypothetical protein
MGMPVVMVLLLLGATVLIVALVLGIIAYTKRRRAALQQRAHEMAQYGWYLAPANPWLADVAAAIYTRGRPGEMFAGDYRGRGMCALDYFYTTSNGKPRRLTTCTW